MDADQDGLSNLGEYRARTRPKDPDTDDDCVADRNEDPDRDRVGNASEMDAGTRPRDPDSDDDGVRDGREDADRDGLSNAREDALRKRADAREQALLSRRPAASPPVPRAEADPRRPPSARRARLPPPPTSPPPPAPAGFVTRSGAQLLLNGAPYRFTGLNIYNANSVDNCWYTLGSGSGLDSSLADIGAGKEAFRAWFFQYQATRNGARDWSAFDHTLAVARARGVKVVATLVNQWGQCEGWGAYVDGYKTESWYRRGYRTTPRAPACPPPSGSGSPRSSRATRTIPRSWRGSSSTRPRPRRPTAARARPPRRPR